MLCCVLLLFCFVVPVTPEAFGTPWNNAGAQEPVTNTQSQPSASTESTPPTPVQSATKESAEAGNGKATTVNVVPMEIDTEVLTSDSDRNQAQAMRFYAMMEPNSPVPPHLQAFIKSHPELRKRIGFRPMMQWHFWANRPKPFFASFIFVLLFSLVFSSLAPNLSRAAQSVSREHFWRSLLIGGLACMVVIWLVRMSVSTQFGWPMGAVLGGCLQLSLMAGLSVIASLIGKSLAFYIKLEKWPAIGDRADRKRFAYILFGALVCALLLQIPGFGELPKIGTRLVGMLAVIGLGSLLIARRRTAESMQE